MKQLKTITPKFRKDIESGFFVFDTETTCLEPMQKNFVFGVVYGKNYQKIIYTFEEFQKEFKHKRYKKKYVFAHNAEFDLLTIFGNIFTELDNKAIFNGKFISATWNDVNFVDSMNILPTSVANLGKIVGKEKLDNDKVKLNTLRKDNITTNDINYCIRDCEIVFDALAQIFNTVGAIKITLASLSMYDFRKNFLDKDIFFNENVDIFFNSYFGGRTEAFKIGDVDAKVHDINSLYPYIMSYVNFPDVRTLKHIETNDVEYLKFLLTRYEGCCEVKVHHKDTYFGYLPVRYTNAANETKLLFPNGTFWTYLNFNELRFAVNSGVVNILEVKSVTFANAIESPFKSFVTTKYKKRQLSKSEFEKFYEKIILNSLYGKFAMRMKFETTYYNQIPFELIEELKASDELCELKLFSKNRDDCFLVTENKKFQKSFFSIATFSSYITSEARLVLLKNLIANEKNGVVYCDTDSIFLEGNFIGKSSNDLGDFKLEDKKIIKILGLKNYEAIEHDEKKKIIKGVSKRSKEIAPNTYEVEQYYKTKEALRRQKESGSKKIVTKVVSNKYDKRLIFSDGSTKPIILND